MFQFSSSPIKSSGSPRHRRCSSDPEFLASPELSPIVHGNIPSKFDSSKGQTFGLEHLYTTN